jgi:hypothetical protein
MVRKNNISLWCMEGKASRVCFLVSCNSLVWLTQSCWALLFCILRISGISLPHIRATERPSSEILSTPSHQNTTRIGYCTRLVTRTSPHQTTWMLYSYCYNCDPYWMRVQKKGYARFAGHWNAHTICVISGNFWWCPVQSHQDHSCW